MESISEKSQNNSEVTHYSFLLFVIKDGENSINALENLEHLCRKWLSGRHTVEVVDIVEDFQTALDHNILVTPSVVITDPKPSITIHGDLSDPDKFLKQINIQKGEEDV